MSKDVLLTPASLSPFTKTTLIQGRPARIECVEIDGQQFTISGGPVATVSLEDEWYEDIEHPRPVIERLRALKGRTPDLFTFWQRMPDVEPKHPYYHEWEEIAVLPVTTHESWWKTQIKSRTRNLIRKSEKDGLVVRETAFDDDFVRGMTEIFNEAPIRQGRRFWHYGKDFKTVKSQFSRFVHREHMIGAYYQDKLVGFIMLGNAGRYGVTQQIISSIAHRDKSPNNALISKAVAICAERGLKYLIYLHWSEDSLSEFKRRCGFEPTKVPRYYVPLTWKGELALKCGAHHGWKGMLPSRARSAFKRLRAKWYERRAE